MDLHLYNYDGENNVINKFATDIQLIKSLDVELRMPFNPLSPTFTISEYHKCNYCHFYYHDTFYACYCDITTLSDGLYQVNCYVDSLTTAYQNGAMLGVQCKMLYSKFGDALVPDTRLVNSGVSTYEEWNVQEEDGSLYLLQLVRQNPQFDPNLHPITEPPKMGVGSNVDFYLLNSGAMTRFWNAFYELSEVTRNIIAPSILSISLIHYTASVIDSSDFQTVSGIAIQGLMNSAKENTEPVHIVINPDLQTGDRIFHIKRGGTNSYPRHYRDITKTINLNITPYTSSIAINLYGVGEISVNPLMMNIRRINNIGVRIHFDWWGLSYYCELLINGTVYPRYNMIGSISEQMPLLMETSINTMRDVYVNGITRTASAGLNIHKQLTNYIQLGAEYMTRLTDYPNVGSVQGHVGGNPAITQGKMMTISLTRIVTQTNPDGFKSLFGAPDGELRFISNMQGYFVAENVHLNINGLPVVIVNEAESQLKTGVYMV